MGTPRGRLATVAVMAACLLTACDGTGSRAASPATSPSPPNWRDTGYTLTCDGVVPGGFRVALLDGAARVPADKTSGYDHFDVRLEATVSGDVNRDGAPDTVVLLQCSPQPSNGLLEEAQVISGASGRRLAELPSPRTLRTAAYLVPVYDPAGLSVVDGDVVAVMKVYGPRDTHAGGPTERVTVRWHWDGRRFDRLQ